MRAKASGCSAALLCASSGLLWSRSGFKFEYLKESVMKKNLHLSLLFACFIAPGLAWAACTTPAGHGRAITYRLTGFNPPSFDPGIRVGTPIYSTVMRAISSIPPGGRFTCSPMIGNFISIGTTGVVGAYSTYPTGIDGVGMRFRRVNLSGVTAWWPLPATYFPGTYANFIDGVMIEIELVKIGNISSGGVISGEVAAAFAQSGISKIISYELDSVVTIKPMIPTCKIIPPATVPLGNISVGKFTGVGVGTAAQPFSIKLNCSGGAPNTQRNIFVTLTDQTAPANRTDVLSLISGSTATGIGIQVYSGSSTIKYGADSSTPGNYNQWFAGSAGNGVFEIPLTARYIQVAAQVTPGSANGRATFTMSYQ